MNVFSSLTGHGLAFHALCPFALELLQVLLDIIKGTLALASDYALEGQILWLFGPLVEECDYVKVGLAHVTIHVAVITTARLRLFLRDVSFFIDFFLSIFDRLFDVTGLLFLLVIAIVVTIVLHLLKLVVFYPLNSLQNVHEFFLLLVIERTSGDALFLLFESLVVLDTLSALLICF